MAVILLVLVLVQRQPCAGLVLVDQAGVGHEAGEAGIVSGATRQVEEGLRHRRPRLAALGVARVVAIARAVGHPTGPAATGHGDRHLEAARRRHAPKRSPTGDRPDGSEQVGVDREGAAAQQDCAFAQGLLALEVEQVGHHRINMAMKTRIPVRWRSVEMPRPAYVPGPTMEKIMADTIRYATADSSLGPFLAARSDRGLAMVEFGTLGEADLKARFPDADVIEDAASLQEMLGKLRELIEHPERNVDLALDLRGSAFELRVWHAL